MAPGPRFSPLPSTPALPRISYVIYIESCAGGTRAFAPTRQVSWKRATVFRASGGRECYPEDSGPLRSTATEEGPVQTPCPPPSFPPDGPRDAVMDLAKTLKIDSVSRLHPSPPLRARPEQTVAEAVVLMRQAGVGCLLVCDGEQ